MKKFNILLIVFMIGFLSNTLSAVPPCCLVDLGIFTNPANPTQLQIKMRANVNIPAGSVLSGGQFVVKYLASYGVTLSIVSSLGNYTNDIPTDVDPMTGMKYYAYTFGTVDVPVTIANGAEIVLVTLQHSNNGTPGSIGTFTIAEGTDVFAASLVGDALDVYYQQLLMPGGMAGGSGQQGVAPYTPATITALPVELTDFNANPKPNRMVLLDWKTASEINLSHYEIDYSTDGTNFNLIGKTDATATQNHGASYTFVHNQTANGDNFYRLRMVDRNGAFEYSPIRVVRFEDKSGGFSILPNPSSGPFSLISEKLAQFDEKVGYQVFDQTGRLLLDNQITNEKTDFDLSEFPAGSYNLIVRSNREVLTQFQLVLTKQ